MVGKYLTAPKLQSTKRKCVTKSQNVASVCSVILSIEDCLRSVIHIRLVTMFLSKYVLIAISMQDSYGKYFVFGFICDYEICVTKSQHVCIFCYVSSTLVSLYHWLLVCLRSVIQVKLVTMFLSKNVLLAISST